MRNILELLTNQRIGEWEVRLSESNVQLIQHKNGAEYCWMANTVWEAGTHRELAEKAFGDVLLGGLGIGYDSLLLEEKESITSIHIIERQSEIIQMVGSAIAHPKVTVLLDRVKHHLETCVSTYDTIWFDIFSKDACAFQKYGDELTVLAQTKLKPGGIVLFWHDHDPIEL